MDEIAFSDWPGSPVDLSGSNPWLPAYGYQPPSSLLDKDDFLGNPDGALFLSNPPDLPQYVYLETIVEETSDELRSDEGGSGCGGSDTRSSSRSACSGPDDEGRDRWLATDSESGSVIHVLDHGIDDDDDDDEDVDDGYSIDSDNMSECESEGGCACPAKRRRRGTPGMDSGVGGSLQPSLLVPPLPSYSDNDSINSGISRSSSLIQFESLEKHCQDIYSSSPSILSLFSQDSLELQKRQVSNASPDSLESTGSDEIYLHDSPKLHRDSLLYNTFQINNHTDSDDSQNSDETLLVSNSRSNSLGKLENTLRTYRSFEGLATKCKERVKEKMSAENLSEDSGYSDHFCNLKKNINMTVQGIIIPKKSTQKMSNELKYPRSYRPLNMRSRGFEAYDGEPQFNNVASCFGSSYQDLTVFEKYDNVLFGKRAIPRTTDVLNIVLECRSKFSRDDDQATSCSEPDLLQRDDTASEHRRCLNTNKTTCKQGFFGEHVCVVSVPKDLNLVSDNSVSDSVAAKNIDLCHLNEDNMATDETTETEIQKAISETSIDFDNMFYHSTPINKKIVTSTPNLTTIEKLELPEDETLLHGSMQNVPRKSSLIDRNDMKKTSSATSSTKGVHFCPVVSEVSWAETSFSSSEEELSGSASSSSDSELHETISNTEKNKEIEYVVVPTSNEVNKHDLESNGGGDHVTDSVGAHATLNEVIQSQLESGKVNMEPPDRKGKLSNFFSRFTSFRFSTRNRNRSKKEVENYKNVITRVVKSQQQRIATIDDYNYFGLEDPCVEKCVKKPPLPQGAGMKRVVRKAGIDREPEVKQPREGDSKDAGRVMAGLCRAATCARTQAPGLIETDLDTHITQVVRNHVREKTHSLMDLGITGAQTPRPLGAPPPAPKQHARPHKSMEFLLDKDNCRAVQPPENELQKGSGGGGGERVMSEHQLRVQRSLQKLHLPDWYKQAAVPREGFLLRSKQNTPTSNVNSTPRWSITNSHHGPTGDGSKTPSLSSLGSGGAQSPGLLLSPAPHHSPFTRWSTSRLNSAASSPCASTRSSFNHRGSHCGITNAANGGLVSPRSSSFTYRQPYLGWRSQERLNKPRTPAERLAVSLLPANSLNTAEIQSSIKEVTSAIVHYVSTLKPDNGSITRLDPGSSPRLDGRRSVSPRGSQKLCWLESSFVGTRPPESPETPITLAPNECEATKQSPAGLRLELQYSAQPNAHLNNGESLTS